MKEICFVTTSSLIVNFFLTPCLATLGRAYRVRLALNPHEDTALAEGHRVEVITLPSRRKISPWSNLRTHGCSVKDGSIAGLLATIARWIAGVPASIHTYTGQVWMTRSGIMKSLLAAAHRTIARFATHLLADSPSQLRVLLELGIVRGEGKCRLLGSRVGGCSPVDNGQSDGTLGTSAVRTKSRSINVRCYEALFPRSMRILWDPLIATNKEALSPGQ